MIEGVQVGSSSDAVLALVVVLGIIGLVVLAAVVWLYVTKKYGALRIMGGVLLGLAALSGAGIWLTASRRWWDEGTDYTGFVLLVAVLAILGSGLIILGSTKLQGSNMRVGASVAGDPLAVARQRLAAGEISNEEYDQLISRLQ